MNHSAASQLLDMLARAYAEPPAVPDSPPQCLDTGAAGVALFHATRAAHDPVSAQRAHSWLRVATSHGVDASHRAGLFYGLPALALVLSLLPTDQYTHARATLTRHLNALAHRRVDTAHERMDSGTRADFGEYDAIKGLSGIGAVLLRVDPNGTAMERLLDYLVRLTEPVRGEGRELPGWWVDHAPWHNPEPAWHGGHANLGMAHGITGALALLSRAHRRGLAARGQEEAIRRICDYLDTWRRHDDGQTWWPAWITRSETGRLSAGEQGRISWCYGTPGLARAQQLAGLALNDTDRRSAAEDAMAVCLKASSLKHVTEMGLCHGLAGLVQIAHQMEKDQPEKDVATPLRTGLVRATRELLHRIGSTVASPSGLLEGELGTGMVVLSTATEGRNTPGWDTCLLLTP